jgi:ABC-type multidrug transport system ATPase subunit
LGGARTIVGIFPNDTSAIRLADRLRGASIADVFDMPPRLRLSSSPSRRSRAPGADARRRARLRDARQPISTFSGDARQRLKLATDMEASATVFVLDEPTTGCTCTTSTGS